MRLEEEVSSKTGWQDDCMFYIYIYSIFLVFLQLDVSLCDSCIGYVLITLNGEVRLTFFEGRNMPTGKPRSEFAVSNNVQKTDVRLERINRCS